jgi:hypothetical protein
MQFVSHTIQTTPLLKNQPITYRPIAVSAVSIWQVMFLPIFLLYLISLASKNNKLCIQKLGTWRYAKTSRKFREEKLNLNVCCHEYEISKINVSTALKRSSEKRNFTKHRIWEWQRNDYTNVSRKRIIQKILKECGLRLMRMTFTMTVSVGPDRQFHIIYSHSVDPYGITKSIWIWKW